MLINVMSREKNYHNLNWMPILRIVLGKEEELAWGEKYGI
jgi:hypothetical protein